MSTYQSKPTEPVTVEAVQYHPAGLADLESLGFDVVKQPSFDEAGDAACVTIDGILVQPGQYVIKGTDGSVRVSDEDAFAAQFDVSANQPAHAAADTPPAE
jgi:hypothetical protein